MLHRIHAVRSRLTGPGRKGTRRRHLQDSGRIEEGYDVNVSSTIELLIKRRQDICISNSGYAVAGNSGRSSSMVGQLSHPTTASSCTFCVPENKIGTGRRVRELRWDKGMQKKCFPTVAREILKGRLVDS